MECWDPSPSIWFELDATLYLQTKVSSVLQTQPENILDLDKNMCAIDDQYLSFVTYPDSETNGSIDALRTYLFVVPSKS